MLAPHHFSFAYSAKVQDVTDGFHNASQCITLMRNNAQYTCMYDKYFVSL